MGCDIHLYVEKRVGKRWWAADRWEQDENSGRPEVPYEKQIYTSRNYDCFAILADVRNGRGFAGCDMGDGFVPIAQPKGLPLDASEEVAAESAHMGSDGHSHSYLTVKELLEFDWTQKTKLRGWLSAYNFWRWIQYDRARGRGPESYSGGVGGHTIVKLTNEELENDLRKALENLPGPDREKVLKTTFDRFYTQVEWTESYHRAASEFWSEVMPRLLHLGNPEDVRIVFWFDN